MKTAGLIVLLVLILSCTGRTVKKTVPVIALQNPVGTKDFHVSEMLTDIRIVRLETADEILLGQNTNYLVGKRYIITIDNEKIIQFSIDGKFLRILVKSGKGPDEFMRVDAFAMDEPNEILYINHRGDYHHIITYDLKNGKRTDRIPTGVDNLISGIIVRNDTVLTIVPRMNEKYNLYYLTTSGKILDGIAPPGVSGIGLETRIERVLNSLYYMPKEYDTLYLVNGTATEAYCFFYVEDRFTFDNNEIGNFVYLPVNAPGFMIANKAHARIKMNNDGETFSMNADKVTRYLVNKNDFSVYEIKDFHNDFLGIEEHQNPWNDYLFINDDLGFICYSSFDLKQKIGKALESGKPDEVIKHRITLLNKQIGENDNPILLIGKLKMDKTK